MSQENIEIVLRLLRANRSGPPEETSELVLLLTDPALEYRSRIAAVEGADYRGHQGVRKFFDDMADAFRTWRNEPDEIVELTPDVVLVDNNFHGVGNESGIEVELRSAVVFAVSEGRVVRCVAYPTREEALQAAGLWE